MCTAYQESQYGHTYFHFVHFQGRAQSGQYVIKFLSTVLSSRKRKMNTEGWENRKRAVLGELRCSFPLSNSKWEHHASGMRLLQGMYCTSISVSIFRT